MNSQRWKICLFFLIFSSFNLAYGNTAEDACKSLIDGQQYVGGFPIHDANPRNLRDRFLNFEQGQLSRIEQLNRGLNTAMELLNSSSLSENQRTKAAEVAGTSLRLLLQGWNYAGNLSLLDGLRVSYPNSASAMARSQPKLKPPLSCAPNNINNNVQIDDLCVAQGFFEEGLRLVLDTLANRKQQGSPSVLVLDRKPIPKNQNISGWFSSEHIPQYTYYIIGNPSQQSACDIDVTSQRIIPILTEGYQVGQMLKKYQQTIQTIAQREWGAASFGPKSLQEDDRTTLRKQAVHTLYMSSHQAFLASLAFAAQTSDQAETTVQSPYREARLDIVKDNLDNRDTIRRIREDKKPTLPVENIAVTDVIIENLIRNIKSSSAIGSINRATTLYTEAKNYLRELGQAEIYQANDDNTRNEMVRKLQELAGIPVSLESLRTEQGRNKFIHDVKERIRLAFSEGREWQGGNFENHLDERLAEFVRADLRRQSKLAILQAIHDRVDAINQRAEKNNNIRQFTSEKIDRLNNMLGILNQMPTISFPSGASYDHFAYAKQDITRDMQRAHERMAQQIDQANTDEAIKSLQSDITIAMSELEELDYEVKQATRRLGQLLGTVENLMNELSRFNERVAQLWYNDPAVSIALSVAEEQANQAQDVLVANLYRLGKMVEYRWQEPFQNPISCRRTTVPLGSTGEYDNFLNLESVFAFGSVQADKRVSDTQPPHRLAEDFYEALKDWDKKLRECQKTNKPDSREVKVSLRKHIKGWHDFYQDQNGRWNEAHPKQNSRFYKKNLTRFHNWLSERGNFTEKATGKDRLRLIFSLDHQTKKHEIKGRTDKLASDSIIPILELNSWNYRLEMIEIMIQSSRESSDNPVFGRNTNNAITHLAQDGITYNYTEAHRRLESTQELHRPWEINLANYVDYNQEDLSLSPSGQYFLFETNAYIDRFESPTNKEMILMWSPFCSKWILQIVSGEINIKSIEDILLKIKYSYGLPPEITWQ